MTTPQHLRDLEAHGLRLVPVGGRPPKTARDVAVYLAACWFEAGAAGKRPKVGQGVVDLWQSKAYRGITDPAHVVARKAPALRAVGSDHIVLDFKGTGTTRARVGEGAGVLLLPAASYADDSAGTLQIQGPVWSWAYGAEEAEHFDATGVVRYGPRA